jgi:hypothetical protein
MNRMVSLQTLPVRRFRSCSPDRLTCPFSLVRLHGPARLPHQAKPAALSLHHCNFYQDFLGWRHPFHRHSIAMLRRTDEAQLGVSMCVANHLDFPPGNHFAANKAIAFLIQGAPLPELIDSSQDVQFFFIG